MIRSLAIAAFMTGLIVGVLHEVIERPAIAELKGELCTNGRIYWECVK